MEERQPFEIEEKVLDTKMGRQINGKPMTLYHDCEYKEERANFEPCVPVRKGSSTDQIDVRELPGGLYRLSHHSDALSSVAKLTHPQ